ncbi:MAG: TonB-dependent receptor [Rhodoferax sp.]|nr:TonB-dependent receptor [Rhodoferax sp.]
MKLTRTPIASAVALVLVGVVASAQAQTATATPELGTVTVTGIRASLETAVNVKRNANAVVDAVSAEDIGKLPDSDVGEALGRIPGVTVGRAFGQGASVSIRGTDPQMTFTTLNGQTVASTGWYDQQAVDRSFNYSLLPSELIGGMDVYKSSQADLAEGGIGGTVIVKTRKPLDLPSGTAYVNASLGKGTVSTEIGKDISGLFSWKNDEKTFGVLVAGAVENGEYIRRGIEADGRWSADVSPTTFVQDRKRQALNVSLQAKPSKELELGLNLMNLQLNANNSNTSQYIFQGNGAPNCTATNAAGLCTKSTTVAANSIDTFFQTWARQAKMTSDSVAFNAAYKGDGFKVEGVAGTTKADGGTSLTTNYSFFQGWNGGGEEAIRGKHNFPKWTGTIDATGKQVVISPSSNQNIGLANLSPNTVPETWASSRGPNTDKENFAQGDLTLDLNWGVVSSLKTGFRTSQHTFTKNSERAVFKSSVTAVPTSTLYSGTIALGTNGWDAPKPNVDAMLDNTLKNISGFVTDRSGFGEINEDNKAAYGMFDFEQGPLRGNVGLRYISTDVKALGYKPDPSVTGQSIGQNNGWSTTLTSQTSNYSDVLPSLNAAFNMDRNTIVRMAAAQVITRPNFDNMFLGNTVAGFNDSVAGNETITIGNPALKPQKSTQFDLGLEYYYGKGNLLAVTYFHKDIDNFISSDTKLKQSVGLTSPDTNKDEWTVNTVKNAGGGKIDGIEAQINHAFDSGFGLAANYTYTDATAPSASYSDKLNVFTLASKHNANLVGYYENKLYSARLAYNWRSEYMIRETGYYGNRMHDAYGTLDLSLGWNLTDKVRIAFEATNILKADDVQYGAASTADAARASLSNGYPAWSFMGESTYKVTLSAKF